MTRNKDEVTSAMYTARKSLFEKRATAVGSYWRSALPPRALRQHLRSCATTHFKTASLGGEQEQGFEQAFSSLAYSYIKDKSPRLLDFIIGFQLVDRNEDNTKAVGLFGFKVGDQWLYVPCFFLNGDLKGHELLYIKKYNTFVPLKENWVNHLISRLPHTLGEPSDQTTFQLGGLMPNLTRLQLPPSVSKYAADRHGQVLPVHVAAWARPFLPLACALAVGKASALYPDLVKDATDLRLDQVVASPWKAALAPHAHRFDLSGFLADFPLLKLAFEQCYLKYPLIKKGFDQFYGADFFRRLAEQALVTADSLVTKAAESYIVPPRPLRRNKKNKQPQPALLNEAEQEQEPKKASLTVIALDVDGDVPITVNKDELTEEERERLLRDTVLIRDQRDPHGDDTSIAYNTQVRMELANPAESGLYEVLEKPGTFQEMVVICHPHSGRGREDFYLVLRRERPRDWLNTHRHNIWVKTCDCPVRQDFVDYVRGLDSVDSLEEGGTYVALHANGSGTVPFRVLEDYGDGTYRVEWQDQVRWWDVPPGQAARRQWPRHREWMVYGQGGDWLVINRRRGSGLRSVNGELYVPADYKVITVEAPSGAEEDDEAKDSGHSGSADTPIQPGNLIDVQFMLQGTLPQVRLHDTGAGEVWIRSERGQERMSKKAALISLVRDHGLREKQARLMLKEAAASRLRGRPVTYFVKYGQGFPLPLGTDLQPGPQAPALPPPLLGVEPSGLGAVPAIYPQEEFLPVDALSSQLANPSAYDPFYLPDERAMQVAQQAVMSGQKEVFDTAMISGMLKSVRQETLIDRYLGDLMKALDKLGRILFMFYWHQEEFEDRYGKQDLPELEDSIRNAFETLGDVCLFLQEKTVKGIGSLLDGVGNPDPSEPSVLEAARN